MVESSFATVGEFLKQRVVAAEVDTTVYEFGEVQSFSDNIVQINGLSKARYGELLEFDGGAVGLTLDLHIWAGSARPFSAVKFSTSSVVRPTGRVAEVFVGH